MVLLLVTLKLLFRPVPESVGWKCVDELMSFDTEGGREVVKIEDWKLWVGDLSAEESGVMPLI